MKKATQYTLLLAFCFSLNAVGQTSTFRSFWKLPCPEKRWVIFHPFKAKTVHAIGLDATIEAQELKADTSLDGDLNGGQLDAFRHTYWMAMVCSRYSWRVARSLGLAHEKGNYRTFKKGKLEDGGYGDETMSQMDFLNNDAGIQIGIDHKDAGADSLKILVMEQLREGRLFIIKKDELGRYLDCEGNVIGDNELRNQWKTRKCIIASDKRNRKAED